MLSPIGFLMKICKSKMATENEEKKKIGEGGIFGRFVVGFFF